MKPTPAPAYLHGEVCIIGDATIPADAKPITLSESYLKLADSETTGNHHVIDTAPGIDFLESGNRRFMRNSVPATVRCVHADRHDQITLEPGCYEFGTQLEYDPFEARMRAVRD